MKIQVCLDDDVKDLREHFESKASSLVLSFFFLACAFDSGPGLWLALLEDQGAHREDAHRGGDTDSERLAQWSQL